MAYTLTIGGQPSGEFQSEQEAQQAYYQWAIDNRAFLGDAVSGTPESNVATINGQTYYPPRAHQEAINTGGSSKASPEQMTLLQSILPEPPPQTALNPDFTTTGQQASLGVSPYEGGMTTDSSGQPAPMGTNQQQGAPTSNPAYPTTQPTQTQTPQLTPQQLQQAYQDSGLTALMDQAGLTPDQRQAIESVFNATLANDQSYADRLAAAMQASSEYSDPYFKAQISLVSDSLSRALGSSQDDLAFREQQLQASLQALNQNIAASKEYMTFQHQQEMEDLARRYELNLENTRNDMAATGFTQSTRRSKSEQYLSDVNEGAVESSNRTFQYQNENLDRQQQFQTQDAAAQIANMQRLAQQGKLDLLRQTEEQLGSAGLTQLGYSGGDVLGGIGGTIPRQQAQDQLAFAQQYVF